MTKAAHFLTSLIFAILCGALWCVWNFGEQYIAGSIGEGGVSETMRIAFLAYSWVFALLPLPLVIYSAVLMDRTELLPEKVLLYFVLMVLVSLLLFGVTGLLFALELTPLVGVVEPS